MADHAVRVYGRRCRQGNGVTVHRPGQVVALDGKRRPASSGLIALQDKILGLCHRTCDYQLDLGDRAN